MNRNSFGKCCGRFVVIVSVIAMMAVCVPVVDGAATVMAQTNTSTAKKKKGSTSTGKQQKASLNQKKTNSAQKNSSKSSATKNNAKQGKAQQGKKNASTRQTGKKAGKQTGTPKSSTEAKKMQEATQREIQQTKEKLRLNEEQIKTGLSDLNRLSADIATGRKQVDGLQKKVAGLNTDITNLGQEITKNEGELKLMREEYLKAVKKMRLTKKNQSTLAFIFASENFNQAMRRLRYMRQFSAWKERKSSDIDAKIKQLGDEREKLAKAKDAQTVALGELTKSQAVLEDNHKKQESLVAQLRQNGDVLQAHLVAKQNEANRLKETISSLIAQEQAKAEAERKAREKAEAERKAKAEAERIAREKAESERLLAEAAAAEKAAAEKAAAEKAAADKAAKKALAEKEAAEKALAKKSAAEKAAAEKEAAEKAKAYKKAQEEKEKADRKFAEAKAKADEKIKKEQEKQEKSKKNSEKSARRKEDRRNHSKESAKEKLTASEDVPTVAPKNAEKAAKEMSGTVNFASLRGSLPRPVDGTWRITNPFGRHSMPEMPEIQYDNPGIDAEVATGAIVKSVCGGKVSGVYKLAGYGTVVIVNHGDYYTVYGNLESVSVSVGTQVGGGHTLGKAGSDPDDPRRGSVHFEVWKGREKQNPSTWLR